MTRRHLIAIAFVMAAGSFAHRHVQATSGYVQIFSSWVVSPATPQSLKTVKFVTGNGAVAGTESLVGSSAVRSFVWTLTDGYVDPGTLGASSATLVGLNDNRMAAGNSAIVDGGPTRAFSWTKSTGIVDLGTLGGSLAEAASINNSGWVVGRSTFNDNIPDDTRPFLWTPSGGMTHLSMPGCLYGSGSFQNGATRVSDSGLVVGYMFSGIFEIEGGGVYHAAVWDTTAHSCTDLFADTASIYRFDYSIADLVTNSGWVAGRISASSSFTRSGGFVWSAATGVRSISGRVTDLNEDGWATAVNGTNGFVLRPGQPDVALGPIVPNLPFFVLDNHIVVGHSYDESQTYIHAFYWDPESGRHELDRPASTDQSIAFNHSGERFVGITYSFDEETFLSGQRLFVRDGTVQTLLSTGLDLQNQSVQIGSTGFIAAVLNDDHAELAKVWAPPLSFNFTGFLAPNDNPYPLFNDARAGSNTQLRFGLGGDRGPEVLAWGYPRLVEADCTTGALPPLDTTEPGPNFAQAPPVTFQKGADRYTFTWSPELSLKNSCRGWLFRFIDGTGGAALFRIR